LDAATIMTEPNGRAEWQGTVVRTTAGDDAIKLGGAPNRVGFNDVYGAHYDSLIRLAILTTGSVSIAEDVVQDAYVALFQQWPDVVEPVAWLRRVVSNRSTSWLRRRLVARRHEQRRVPAAEYPPPAAEDTAVRNALLRLSHRQRAAVYLRFYLDLPEREIAAALGCRPGTVKSLLHRSLAVLKENLDED
jgi:RNA polymerase sigma-70 factor (sigma-E family)